MIRFLFVAMIVFFAMFAIAAVIALIVSTLVLLAIIAAVGIPAWLMLRHWSQKRGVSARPRSTIDRLRDLYIEGKIDLFEFEQRVERLVAVERS